MIYVHRFRNDSEALNYIGALLAPQVCRIGSGSATKRIYSLGIPKKTEVEIVLDNQTGRPVIQEKKQIITIQFKYDDVIDNDYTLTVEAPYTIQAEDLPEIGTLSNEYYDEDTNDEITVGSVINKDIVIVNEYEDIQEPSEITIEFNWDGYIHNDRTLVVTQPYTLTWGDLPSPGSRSNSYYDENNNSVSAGTVITENTTIYISYENCFVKDTPITLYNGLVKLVQDITYDDDLLVWDFDNACVTSAKPLWISKCKTSKQYVLCKLSNETELKLVGHIVDGVYKSHRLFNYTDQRFDYPQDCIGKQIYTENGLVTLISCEEIFDTVEYYNIITNYHINLFANSILTSCRYNNIYPIENMKFIKDNRELVPYDVYKNEIPYEYYIGMRLGEQEININDTIEYVHRLISTRF